MLRSLTALALLTLPATAFADSSYRCDQNGIAVEVQTIRDSATTKLLVNGDEVPALLACVTSFNGNPNMGGKWRCPHGAANGDRYEVYPMLPRNGDAPYVRIISWTGARSRAIELKDCE